MKKLIYIIIVLLAFGGVISCVDDYQEFNPPRLKDGPYFKVTLSEDSVVGGNSVNFTVSVIDAPGGIDSFAVSNPQRLGSFTLNNFEGVRGDNKGEFSGTFVSPTTFEGNLALTFELFDRQTDDKGEDARKSSSQMKSLYVEFPAGVSDFDIVIPSATFVRGAEFDVTIDVANAEGGVDSIFATVSEGAIEITEADLNAIKGETSGSLVATYTSDEEFVGDIVITVSVIDGLQRRTATKEITVTAEYEFAAPTVTLTLDQEEFKPFTPVGFEIDITAPGTIDTVMVESVESSVTVEGELIGDPEMDEEELEAAIGETAATITGTFLAPSTTFIDIKVTVIDEQGRSTTDEVRVLVYPPCDKSDIAGTYRSVTDGVSAYEPEGPFADLVDTVTITGAEGNQFNVSDLSFGLWDLQGYDPEPGPIITCDGNIVLGGGFVRVISGVVNMDGTIEIEWDSPDGDSGSTVLTPIPEDD